jgi:hypothetical protein
LIKKLWQISSRFLKLYIFLNKHIRPVTCFQKSKKITVSQFHPGFSLCRSGTSRTTNGGSASPPQSGHTPQPSCPPHHKHAQMQPTLSRKLPSCSCNAHRSPIFLHTYLSLDLCSSRICSQYCCPFQSVSICLHSVAPRSISSRPVAMPSRIKLGVLRRIMHVFVWCVMRPPLTSMLLPRLTAVACTCRYVCSVAATIITKQLFRRAFVGPDVLTAFQFLIGAVLSIMQIAASTPVSPASRFSLARFWPSSIASSRLVTISLVYAAAQQPFAQLIYCSLWPSFLLLSPTRLLQLLLRPRIHQLVVFRRRGIFRPHHQSARARIHGN